MITVAEARAAIDRVVGTHGTERVGLLAALGRVLSGPVLATFDQPRFDGSAMDGYAVRCEDIATATREHPRRLDVVGLSAAGPGEPPSVGPGQCVQVMTGGVMPEGADAVVIVENTGGYADETAEIHATASPGDNIRRRGEEVGANELLLGPGTRVGPAELGTLASFGYSEVTVARRPKLALLTTGDELQEVGTPLRPGEIYDSTASLLGVLARIDADLVLSESVRDDRAALGQALARATDCAEVLVVCGGVSMGRFDHVREQVATIGLQEAFWRVAQKPGKPLLFAHDDQGQKLLFGLPGNPVSSLVCFVEYVRPALQRWQGAKASRHHQAVLTAPLSRIRKRHRFVLAHAIEQDGCLHVTPSTKQGSHMLTASLGANCICEAAPSDTPIPAGDSVTIRFLPWAEGIGGGVD